ncbi:MAG: LPS biosynthesis protein WbpP [Candidatus Hydrogenedentota bacterium]|nr:MAG: LPS biosynthesis protein WbpP [Candidatus Hydrogenedentota bacterium]
MSVFLVTGGAGFIGSNLIRALLERGDTVRVLDNFYTGFSKNIDPVSKEVEFFEGSICDEELLKRAMDGVDYCLHQAAIGSVPRSIDNPLPTNKVNSEGSMKVFLAARDAGVKRVVFASSSSVFGNNDTYPTMDEMPLNPVSPYAVSKAAMESYARVFSSLYDIDLVGLRYFNVFGPFQNPDSEYSAVIPLFIKRLLKGEQPVINGDGLQSRDFSFVDNVVSANLLACEPEEPIAGMVNVACGKTTSVLELATIICEIMGIKPDFSFRESRQGDIQKSLASIAKAKDIFGYEPLIHVREGLERTVDWYRQQTGE